MRNRKNRVVTVPSRNQILWSQSSYSKCNNFILINLGQNLINSNNIFSMAPMRNKPLKPSQKNPKKSNNKLQKCLKSNKNKNGSKNSEHQN